MYGNCTGIHSRGKGERNYCYLIGNTDETWTACHGKNHQPWYYRTFKWNFQFCGYHVIPSKINGNRIQCNGCQRIQRHRLYPFIAGDSYHSIGTGWSISCNFSICKDSKGSRFYDYAADGCGNGNFRYIHAWKRSTEGILLVSDSFL